MILNIRGTHGSGKSTIALQLLKKFEHEALGSGKRPEGYRIWMPKVSGAALFLVGPYATQCGGCDAIQPYALIWPRVLQYARRGHVLFEGALVSSSVGEIGRAMARRKDCVVGFMDTPLEECIRRIERRREARGDNRQLNPHNTTVKFQAVERSRPKLEELGLRCVTLRHKSAVQQVLKLFKEAE